jgi:hypothetical protein
VGCIVNSEHFTTKNLNVSLISQMLLIVIGGVMGRDPDELEQKSIGLIRQLRSGLHLGDIVDGMKVFVGSFSRAQEMMTLLETHPLPSISCYNDILTTLQVDCQRINETQQRSFTLNFTKCFYNISGIAISFQEADSEEHQIEGMSRSSYQIYILFKQHWRNLCYFSQQLILSEETALSLGSLLHSMVASTLAGFELREELNRTTNLLQEALLKIENQINEGNQNVGFLFDTLKSLHPLFEILSEFIQLAEFLIQNLKFFFVVVIILSIFGILIPRVIGSIIFVSIIVFIADRFLVAYCLEWNGSGLRSLVHMIYSICCFAYPMWIFVVYVRSIVRRLYRIYHR